MEKEIRSAGEIRATTDEGILEAYLTKWDSVDSYRSTFERGAFKKTFEERGNAGKIKLLWDHSGLIGKVLESREDNYGPWIKAQINLDTSAGKEAFAHLRAGDVDAMSFGFNVIQDRMDKDLRIISEIRCLEVSPCVFPANESASIISVREEAEEAIPEEWNINELSIALYRHCKGDLDTLAKETAFTMAELRTMAEGRTLNIEKRDKLAELSDEIRTAHQKVRCKAVKELCDELQAGGFDAEEMKTFRSLLENKGSHTGISEMVSSMKELRTGLIKEK